MNNRRSSSGANRPRRSGGRYVNTRSGKSIKVNQSLSEKWSAMRSAKLQRKAERMAGLPKSRVKRLVWRLNPKRQAEFWLSRDGAILGLKFVGVAIVVFFILTMGVFAFFRKDLPDITDISGDNLGGSVSYYDRTGKILLWQDYNAVKRVPVQSSDISKYMKQATIAAEDRNFYNEKGFDIRGIMRAAYKDVKHGSASQGGSTITQQLVKLTQDWTQQRTFTRKLKELILAVEVERTYTKDQILTGYLNIAPYGGVDYGVQAAAADYFHKGAKDLTLPEAAMLAAIPKAPSYYSPYAKEYFDKNAFLDRYHYVLDSMVITGAITKDQAEAAKKVDVLAEVHPQSTKYAGIKAPYFVLAAKKELENRYTCNNTHGGCNKIGGWKVITTLDMNLQKQAEKVVADNLQNVRNHGGDTEATVAEDVETGQMLALVGGTDFNDPDHGQINYAQTNISPGSSFKPYDYAALINYQNAGAGSVLYDSQGPLPGYSCTNKGLPPPRGQGNCLEDYDFRYPGAETLRYALGGSRNVPAVKAMLSVVPNDTTKSVNKVINMADDMMNTSDAYRCFASGVDVNNATKADETQCYGASAIGDGAYLHLDNHVNGLSTMARLGLSIPQTYILQIYNSKNPNKPFYQWKQPKAGDPDVKQVISPQAAYIVDNMASDPNASYLPFGYYKWHRYNGWHIAIKTGTTNNGFDGLMMAWTPKIAVGSWVGWHTRNKSLAGAMEYSTTPLTRGLMTYALDSLHTQPIDWKRPSGIQTLPAYVIRNHIGIGSVEPSPSTDLFPSWYKQPGVGQSQTIDKVSGKLATSCTPPLAKQTISGNASADRFSVDIFTGHGAAASRTVTGNDDVHSCSDSPPTINLTATNNNDGTATLAAFVSAGTHPFNDPKYTQYPGTVTFQVNGKTVGTAHVSDPQDNVSVTYKVPSTGTYTVTATVTDSVLYSATDSKTANFTGGSSQGPTNLQATGNGTKVTLSWTGGTPTFTVFDTDGNQISGCSDVDNNSCQTTKAAVLNKEIYVQDANGNKSPTYHVSVSSL